MPEKGKEQRETVIPTGTNGKARTVERAAPQPPGRAYWLIAKTGGDGTTEVLTLDSDGEEVLPVFSFEEEAAMFLRLGDAGDEWRVRESRAGELVSVLRGPCAGVKEVALDPLPRMVVDKTVGLVSLLRERFIERVITRMSSNGTALG